ncbi:MAG: hypothetical protein AAGA96_19810 [Verrucomicrobiota bacterium]
MGTQVYGNGQFFEERAYQGIDYEFGAKVLGFGDNHNEIRVFGGGFYFDNDAPGFPAIAGPRGRVEMRLFDVPFLGEGSRVTLSGEVQWDEVRETNAFAGINIQIPLGRTRAKGNPFGASKGYSGLNRLERRMLDPIVRDVDIVTNIALNGSSQIPVGPLLVEQNGRLFRFDDDGKLVPFTGGVSGFVMRESGEISFFDGSRNMITRTIPRRSSGSTLTLGSQNGGGQVGTVTVSSGSNLTLSGNTIGSGNNTYTVTGSSGGFTLPGSAPTGGNTTTGGNTSAGGNIDLSSAPQLSITVPALTYSGSSAVTLDLVGGASSGGGTSDGSFVVDSNIQFAGTLDSQSSPTLNLNFGSANQGAFWNIADFGDQNWVIHDGNTTGGGTLDLSTFPPGTTIVVPESVSGSTPVTIGGGGSGGFITSGGGNIILP